MKNDLKLCRCCSHNFRVRIGDDVVLLAHWDGNYYLIDIGLFFEGSRLLFVLYHDVYVTEQSAKHEANGYAIA